MRMFFAVALLLTVHYSFAGGINVNKSRAEKIRKLMWMESEPEFKVIEVPEKWEDESAVIIGKENSLSYRKEALLTFLNYHHYTHYRIKLQSSSALEQYAEFSVPGTTVIGNVSVAYYAGFKVIKPDGREIVISLEDMVKENASVNRSRLDRFKIAIPGLEENDIIDYYIAEEQRINLYSTRYYSFDPVIYELNDEFPVMHQNISFDVLRRCFINAKSLNGAPELELASDDKEDRNRYTLIDKDRERIDPQLWLYRYRAVPTIKFKVTYAYGSLFGDNNSTFIGKPGILKTELKKKEIIDFIAELYSSKVYYPVIEDFMKEHHSGISDKETLARKAYYVLRFLFHVKYREKNLLNYGQENRSLTYKSVKELTAYYKSVGIKHDIIIGIPRFISELDDLILENELSYMIRVNEGDQPVYLSYFDENAYYGEINSDLQGTRVYAVNGLLPPSSWNLKEEVLPVISHESNRTVSTLSYSIKDLDEGLFLLKGKESVKGPSQDYYQAYLTDFYTFKEEEFESYPTEDKFYKEKKKKLAQLVKRRDEYLAKRPEDLRENLKILLEEDVLFEVKEILDVEVERTGRFEDQPEFEYSYSAEIQELIKRVGNNYLLDAGKLIDKQIQLEEKDRDREYDIYMPYARSFEYRVTFEIPEGYAPQGLDKLEIDIDNATGGFRSSTEMKDNVLEINIFKHYKSNFEPKENWPLMLEFLDAADSFNDLKILLKKS